MHSDPMPSRYGASPGDISGMDTARLRAEFLVEGLFRTGALSWVYTHLDRMLVGGACPAAAKLAFGEGSAVGTANLLDAREMGIANLGAAGTATVDGRPYRMENRDVLYVGRGTKAVTLESDAAERPARFYMNCVPAGADIPTRLIRRADAKPLELGDAARANRRTLRMYIHPEVAPSCLLLMGITDFAPGNIWNTMPPHLHERRMEAYCYFDLDASDRVIHLMGRPDNTRHLIAADGDIVLSPAWSIHMGAGTGPYAFVWGMTGENQAYGDVEPVPVSALR
jgi:4-deoxy-L-threo-5-hexosulose-uronate ketol-isomerase